MVFYLCFFNFSFCLVSSGVSVVAPISVMILIAFSTNCAFEANTPFLRYKLSSRIIKGTRKQAKGKSVEKISNIRDEYLVSLLKMRKKFENKLR